MRTLRYAVRPRPVLKYFGQLCFGLTLLMCVPLGVALLAADFQVSWCYGVVIAAVLALGLGLKHAGQPPSSCRPTGPSSLGPWYFSSPPWS